MLFTFLGFGAQGLPHLAPTLLSSKVDGLLHKHAIVPVSLDQERDGYFSTYFIVTTKDGGLRPILNLKFFNKSVARKRFKMETLHSIMTVMSPDQCLASLDLKDTYFFHVLIQSSHQNFLRFHLQGETYQFQSLPFGLSSAPWVFTKVLAPVIAYIRIFVHLDDILVGDTVLRRSGGTFRLLSKP